MASWATMLPQSIVIHLNWKTEIVRGTHIFFDRDYSLWNQLPVAAKAIALAVPLDLISEKRAGPQRELQ